MKPSATLALGHPKPRRLNKKRVCGCEWCSREPRADQPSLIVNPNVQK